MSRSSSTFIQLIYPSPSFEIYGNSLTTKHVAGEIVAKWLHPYNYAPQNFGTSFSIITIITGNPTLFLFDLVSAAPKHQRKVRLPNIHPSRWCHRAGVRWSQWANPASVAVIGILSAKCSLTGGVHTSLRLIYSRITF